MSTTANNSYGEAWHRPATDQIHAGTAQQLPAHPVRQPLYLSAAYGFGILEQDLDTALRYASACTLPAAQQELSVR